MRNTQSGVFQLAMQILKAEELSHDHAVEIAMVVRETIMSLTIAMALVSNFQNPDMPIVATREDLEEIKPRNPGELLVSLGDGFEELATRWEELVDLFGEGFNKYKGKRDMAQMEKDLESMPETLFVSDILDDLPKEEK